MESNLEVCADCDAPSPNWASVNRGVLLCDDCSSIHRQLGRHVSQVKHLKKSRWRTSQLDMVRYLVAAGANRHWEHILYEPLLSGKRAVQSSGSGKHGGVAAAKPKPSDPLHTVKAEFIREKYLFLGFFKKPQNLNQDDLNQQLHASVRTGILETSLYLLALGANPNFVHPVKGTSPMHVACQYNQLGQVEVLLAYGADVCIRDSWGQTPIDVAFDRAFSASENSTINGNHSLLSPEQQRNIAWSPLVDALVDSYYEVTDSLAYFLCRSVPDHKRAILGLSSCDSPMLPTRTASLKRNAQKPARNGYTATLNGHFLISSSMLQSNPHDGQPRVNTEEWMIKARSRLQQLPNLAFEDLCIDVYDEADRRLTNSFLETMEPSTSQQGLNGFAVDTSSIQTSPATHSLALYFLPPNTAYSSVRNQARQKLGRLSTVEFHTLVLDVLTEISVRLLPLFPPTISSQQPNTQTLYSSTPLELPPNSASSRLTPLPPPPAVDPGDSETEPTSPGTNVSSSASMCEPDTTPDLALTKANTDDIRKRMDVIGVGNNRRGDDPVYDQVAAESDIASVSTTAESTAPYSHVVGNIQKSASSSTDTEIAAQPPCFPSPIYDNSVQTEESSIISSAGPVPGSRRIHLPHTGRVNPNRASVPAAHPVAPKLPTDFPLSPVLEAANLAIQPGKVIEGGISPTRQPACCSVTKEDVDRLLAENLELKSQLLEFQENNRALEQRLQSLEDKVKASDLLISSLRTENALLQQALSSTSHVTAESPCQLDRGQQSTNGCQSLPDSTMLVEEKQEQQTSVKRNDPGAYSVGSDVLPSGLLFRQGIALRSNRGGSPAPASTQSTSLSPNSVALTKQPGVSQSAETVNSNVNSKSITSYVNLPRLMPKPTVVKGAPNQPTSTKQTWSVTVTSPHFIMSSASRHDDYVSPNSTGCSSPAPLPTSEYNRTDSQVKSPAIDQQQVLQRQHDQILASIASLPDYESGAIHSTSSKIVLAPSQRQGPSSDQVVRCVEAIIVRIRNLVQLANGERTGDFTECSVSIEAAVQGMLSLFPPIVNCPANIAGPLSELSLASHGLQPHCEQMTHRLKRNNVSHHDKQSMGSDVNAVIRHAHRIAKAAKDLLSIFQGTN